MVRILEQSTSYASSIAVHGESIARNSSRKTKDHYPVKSEQVLAFSGLRNRRIRDPTCVGFIDLRVFGASDLRGPRLSDKINAVCLTDARYAATVRLGDWDQIGLLGKPRSVESRGDAVACQLRFHPPLIKPDVRISRIRLSDKESRVRPREVACSLWELDESQILMQVAVGEA